MQCETKKFEWNIAEEEAPTDQIVLSWYISETEKEKRRERNKREESYHERRRDRHVEWQWRLAANVGWCRPVCVRGSDGGYVWERVMEACECERDWMWGR